MTIAWSRFGLTLNWRTEYSSMPLGSLYAGNIHIGTIMKNRTQAKHDVKPWRMWLMTTEDGEELGYRATEQEAKDDLIDAALKALFTEEVA